jgi:tRNA (guanine37-N1)-methyltransferase
VKFHILTIFPEFFEGPFAHGVVKRAKDVGILDIRIHNLRDWTHDRHKTVDDRPFGGGPGMVMLAEPLERALAAVAAARAQAGASAGPVVLFTPTGRRIDQALVREWAAGPGAVLLCGRYEGIDQRVIDRHVDIELSLGDFVLSGGELPALTLLDAIARLQPGVLGDEQSHLQDSFEQGLLDCPHYSRPEVLATADGPLPVPPVLLSGHHADIARWRREQSLKLTAERRPDLIAAARAAGLLDKADEQFLSRLDSAV